MINEELEFYIDELVEEIRSQQFIGTEEEIKFQQVLYFDKYVKEHIDYGFEALEFSMSHPGEENPYESAFRTDGFFEINKATGKRLAVCGGISTVANIVLNKLGIECNYVWGHFNAGTEEEPIYGGHRWNEIVIGSEHFMVDFTNGMLVHNINKDNTYKEMVGNILGIDSESHEYDFLFFDKLLPNQSLNGFKKDANGRTIDDLDENGRLINTVCDPNQVISNLGSIPPEIIAKYAAYLPTNKTL